MATYNPSALIGALKGSIGSTNFQSSGPNSIIKNKSYKKGSTSLIKTAATSELSRITMAWRGVSDSDKLEWDTNKLDWPFTDKFGNTYYGPAYQFYTAFNRNLRAIGQGTVSVPSKSTTPAYIGPFIFSSSAYNLLKIVPTGTGDADTTIIVYASPSYSAGRNNNNATLKTLNAFGTNGILEFDCTDYYYNVYGSPIVGMKVIFKIAAFNNGFPYPRFVEIISTIIT